MHIFFFSSQFSSFQLVRCHGPPQIATVDACVCDFWFLWFATGMPLVVVLCASGDVPLDSLFHPQRFCLFAGDSSERSITALLFPFFFFFAGDGLTRRRRINASCSLIISC